MRKKNIRRFFIKCWSGLKWCHSSSVKLISFFANVATVVGITWAYYGLLPSVVVKLSEQKPSVEEDLSQEFAIQNNSVFPLKKVSAHAVTWDVNSYMNSNLTIYADEVELGDIERGEGEEIYIRSFPQRSIGISPDDKFINANLCLLIAFEYGLSGHVRYETRGFFFNKETNISSWRKNSMACPNEIIKELKKKRDKYSLEMKLKNR